MNKKRHRTKMALFITFIINIIFVRNLLDKNLSFISFYLLLFGFKIIIYHKENFQNNENKTELTKPTPFMFICKCGWSHCPWNSLVAKIIQLLKCNLKLNEQR